MTGYSYEKVSIVNINSQSFKISITKLIIVVILQGNSSGECTFGRGRKWADIGKRYNF